MRITVHGLKMAARDVGVALWRIGSVVIAGSVTILVSAQAAFWLMDEPMRAVWIFAGALSLAIFLNTLGSVRNDREKKERKE